MVLLPERGQLEETAFPSLLADLHRACFSGAVRMSRDRVEKVFLFREGIPVFAESSLTRESLGMQLLDAGEISRSDYDRIVRHVEGERCKEGKAILDLEIIEPRDLFLAVKKQVRASLIECFGWTRGVFTIEAGDPPAETSQPFLTDLHALIQEGIETHWGSDRILADLGPHMNQFAKAGALVSLIQRRLRSDEAVVAFLGALDGTRTLWKAVQCAATPRALAAAWILDAFQAIEYSDTAVAESGPEPEPDEPPELEIVFGDADEKDLRRNSAAAAEAAADAEARASGPAAAELCRDITAKFLRLGVADYYELLSVDPSADATAIKRAYLKAAKYYHPDALARLGVKGDIRGQANKVFAEIGKAYAVLSNPKHRKKYDASLAGGDSDVDAEQVATAETLYRKGEILLRLGNFKGALEFLQPAVDIYPDEADYQGALGWALYKKVPSEPELAKTHLERALEISSKDATLCFRLGVVLRSLGDSAAAAELLTRAKNIDPEIS